VLLTESQGIRIWLDSMKPTKNIIALSKKFKTQKRSLRYVLVSSVRSCKKSVQTLSVSNEPGVRKTACER
jgi:hypothetical protein